MDKFDILWKGEYVSVVSPKEHPYESLHEINGIMVIPIAGNKIGIRKELCPPYLIKDETGKQFYYTVVSGGVEEGETPEEATVRELEEEAGITFESPKVIEVFREMPVCKSTDMRMTFFIYEDDKYEVKEPEGDGTEYEDIAETIWITLEQFKKVIEQDNIDFLLYSAYYFLTLYLKKEDKQMESSLKITHLGNSLYQIGDNDVPVTVDTLVQLVTSSLYQDDELAAQEWVAQLDKEGTKELPMKTADKGVIVDLYEVDYTSPDPMKDTQELARHLNEKEDFVTQYLFPGSETDEVLIGLRRDILHEQQKPQLVTETSFRVSNQKVLSADEENHIKQTGMLPPYLLEESFKLKPNSWLRLKFKKEGKVVDSIIGGDTFRYLISVQQNEDIENFDISYKNLVLAGVNPLDFVGIIKRADERMPDSAYEDTTIDELIASKDLDIRNVFAIRTKINE